MGLRNLERIFEMYFYIMEARVTHYDTLMREFNISKPTAIYCVRIISDYLEPLETKSGPAGYIKVLNTVPRTSRIKLSSEDAITFINLYDAIKNKDEGYIEGEREKILMVLHKLMILTIMPCQQNDEL